MMKVTFPFINARKSSLECAFVEDDCCGADLSGHSAGSLRLHSSMDDRAWKDLVSPKSTLMFPHQ